MRWQGPRRECKEEYPDAGELILRQIQATFKPGYRIY